MKVRLAAAAAAFALLMTAAAAGAAYASHDTAPCADVTLVFARGSGQTVGEPGKEAARFFSSIDDRADSDVHINSYELGSQAHGGAKYPAVGIGADSAQHFKNLLEADAAWTTPLGGQYRASVASGVTEARSYLGARAARCSQELFVVGGYSQGAQVMGDALAGLDRSVRNRIAYVALFGDPKLYLPEGRGVFPPACRGGEMSPWRRGNVSCFTDNGILEARIPYVPTDMQDRVGSWCDREDPICNNNMADFAGSTHGIYREEGNGIDEAALEAVEALAGSLPGHADDLDTSILVFGVGTAGVDVAFLIDTTGSMADDIDAARLSASSLATAITGLRGRVALTEYRDAGDDVVAAVRSPLSSDIAQFQNALSPLVASGGGDAPEALLSALMTTFNGLNWRPGAVKAAVVLTDAGYHDPDLANGWTLSQVVARSIEIDPVNVYLVVPGDEVAEYQDLADQTSGQVILNSGDTQGALLAAVTEIETRPTALLAISEFWAAVGTPVLFNASGSYDADSSLASFDWDFDGDGTIDQTTTGPTTSHTYSAAFDGIAEVRVHSSDGGVANAVATMHINGTGLAGLQPAAPTRVWVTLTNVAASRRTVHLHWTPASTGGAVAAWRIHDDKANLIGQAAAGATSIDIANVPNGPITLTITAVNGYGASAATTVDVPARSGAPVPTLTPTPEPTDAPSLTPPVLATTPPLAATSASPPASATTGTSGFGTVVCALAVLAVIAAGVAIALVIRRRSNQ